jgi:GTP diphosphokinase / guanosine-3',5'-bis(diphosphate) 3'-diphosphatase
VTKLALNVSKEEFVWGYIKSHNVPIFEKSYKFAQYCHREHFRQDGTPYFGHPNEVCYVLLINNIYDEKTLSDGITHDIIEELRDQSKIILPPREIYKETSSIIVTQDTVALTKPHGDMELEELVRYFNGIENHIRRVLVKTTDRFCNMRRSMFGNFNEERMEKYDVETVRWILSMSERIINNRLHPEYENVLRMLRSSIKGLLEGVRCRINKN